MEESPQGGRENKFVSQEELVRLGNEVAWARTRGEIFSLEIFKCEKEKVIPRVTGEVGNPLMQ
jgi:hypothetical protein